MFLNFKSNVTYILKNFVTSRLYGPQQIKTASKSSL